MHKGGERESNLQREGKRERERWRGRYRWWRLCSGGMLARRKRRRKGHGFGGDAHRTAAVAVAGEEALSHCEEAK